MLRKVKDLIPSDVLIIDESGWRASVRYLVAVSDTDIQIVFSNGSAIIKHREDDIETVNT